MGADTPTRVVILGGGFGGVYTALHLEKALARGERLDVTLVNRENFFLFTPMLHEVAASDLDMTHIVNPIRKLLRRVKFVQGDVESIDLHARRLTVSHGAERHHHDLTYDHLVIALGSVTNFYGLPGVKEHALTMKSLGDAIYLRNHLIETLEQADFECASGARQKLLTFVVAGGGFAGVETVAGVNDFVREALEFYPNLRQESVRIVVVHDGRFLLPELGEKLGTYTQEKLTQRKIEVRLQTRIAAASDEAVVLSDGTRIPSQTLIWTAGTSPHPLLATLPCKTERGRVVVNECMEVPEWPGVWALGDCARVPDPSGQPYPPTAQHAIRQGKVLATNIVAASHSRQSRPFVFKTIGLLASIGKRTGVANILGVNFSGFIAWWLWRTIYLSKLPRLEKKMRVALDWFLDLVFSKDLVQFRTIRGDMPSHPEEPSPEAAQLLKETAA